MDVTVVPSIELSTYLNHNGDTESGLGISKSHLIKMSDSESSQLSCSEVSEQGIMTEESMS